MNFPMSLTILRIFFVPLLVVLLLTQGHDLDLWAVGVFLLAAVTDLFDGYLARRRGQVTALGILLDPLADKLLTCSAFISLVELRLAPAWMVVIIVGRELAVSGLRAVAAVEGFAIAAAALGKTKMVLQVIAITGLILAPRFPILHPWDKAALWLVVLFAVVSATQYFWNFWRTWETRRASFSPLPMVVLPGGKEEPEKKDVAAH